MARTKHTQARMWQYEDTPLWSQAAPRVEAPAITYNAQCDHCYLNRPHTQAEHDASIKANTDRIEMSRRLMQEQLDRMSADECKAFHATWLD